MFGPLVWEACSVPASPFHLHRVCEATEGAPKMALYQPARSPGWQRWVPVGARATTSGTSRPPGCSSPSRCLQQRLAGNPLD